MTPPDPVQTPARPGPDPGLVGAIRALHGAAERIDAAAAARLGITRSDLACLHLLAAGPASPRAIGAALGLASGSVTALVDRLERRGFVRRKPDRSDRRGVLVEAMPAASAAMADALAPLAEALARLEERYGEERSEAAARQVADLARLCDWAAGQIAGGAP